ncbi:BTB/POZ domain-containing protein [Hordeum vulgare]|nr:BTB/POZ domain-containing protein [Hordeum vulgare]
MVATPTRSSPSPRSLRRARSRMAEHAARHLRRRGPVAGWCCSFAGVPPSPDHRTLHHRSLPDAATAQPGSVAAEGPRKPPPQQLPPKSPSSFHGSPSSKLAGLIDYPRRILSPGRVSPIDPDAHPHPPTPTPITHPPEQQQPAMAPFVAVREEEEEGQGDGLDLRLCLRGRDGAGCVVVMDLDSSVLCGSSAFFAAMAPEPNAAGGARRIEVDGVDNVAAFRDAVELMFQADAPRWLARAGVSRAIGVLEVASSIMFDKGIRSCLEYIEAVPWTENEEEKLKHLFARCTFDEALSKDVLARLQTQPSSSSEDLTDQLIQSVTSSTNNSARKDMQSLINGLLSKSSVYQKDLSGLNKRSLYQICCSCLNLLVELFKEDSEPKWQTDQALKIRHSKPMIERVSKQSENLSWLFEILVNNDMAENFVVLWAGQDELIRMHEQASPMFRYELSRISAGVFIALGQGKVQCPSDLRSQLFRGWFTPMLTDFGWLQRCSKGLDARALEDSLGQALLTLPLREQQSLFEEWFQCFASSGAECPNLSRAFQVWWRRSFAR